MENNQKILPAVIVGCIFLDFGRLGSLANLGRFLALKPFFGAYYMARVRPWLTPGRLVKRNMARSWRAGIPPNRLINIFRAQPNARDE